MDSTVIRNKEIYSKEWQNLYTEKKEFLKNSLLVPNFNMLAYICIKEKHSGIFKNLSSNYQHTFTQSTIKGRTITFMKMQS